MRARTGNRTGFGIGRAPPSRKDRTEDGMRPLGLTLIGLVCLGIPARAADAPSGPRALSPAGRFLATCEDLGRLCFGEGCGRDQIDAALACRAACPGSVTVTVQPDACPLPAAPVRVVLRRRG